MESSETLRLATAASQGSSEAFSHLYDYFAPRIYKFIQFKVQSREQAEDILQDTFLKVWQALPKVNLENFNFSAWLYRIARNTVNDYYRRQYRKPEPVELNENMIIVSKESLVGDAVTSSEIEQVKLASKHLPAHYRQVLELRFVQEFSVTETAQIVGKSSLAVRLIQHRALKQLRQILSNDYDVQYQEI